MEQHNMSEMEQGDEIDLIELFLALKRRIVIIILAAIAGIVIMGGYTVLFVTPMYSATSMLYVLTTSTSITSLADIQLGTQLTSDYSILMTTHPVIDTVIENLGLDMSYEELVGKITIDNPSDTRILNITVTDPVPETAQNIANELAAVTVVHMAEVMKTEEPSIAEEAQLPTSPVSPNLSKNCAIGALAGLILSAGIVIILYLINDKVHTEDDIEKYLHMTTLGIIPSRESKKQKLGRRKRHDKS